MSSLLSACRRLAVCASFVAAPLLAFGQQSYGPQGTEYRVLGHTPLPGDQVFSDIALNARVGYIVWQDNVSDSSGLGISAQRIDQSLTGAYAPFRVNHTQGGDQESPKVAVQPNGGAIFVWKSAGTNIVARIMGTRGLMGAEVIVNTDQARTKNDPQVAPLADGSYIVVWASEGQDGSMQGIYSQRLSVSGEKIGGETRVSTKTFLNQRTPAVTALKDGGYVIAWVHEAGTIGGGLSINLVGRVWNSAGSPIAAEFQVNTAPMLCANPAMITDADGSFVVAWSQKIDPMGEKVVRQSSGQPLYQSTGTTGYDTNSWDVVGRGFSANGTAKGGVTTINSLRVGAQFAPRLGVLGSDLIAVWTSIGQDGDQEGVYGRFFNSDLQVFGADFRVNTQTASKQLHPAVGTSSDNRFLVVWSGYSRASSSFDLAAQRYERASLPLEAPSAPFVSALTQTRLSITWPGLSGLAVSSYLLFIDGSATPIEVTGTSYVLTHLAPKSTHTVKLKYKLSDGRISPASPEVQGTTWDEDGDGDGLPDDWQATYWGSSAAWANAETDSDNDGARNIQELLAGTDPTDANDVLKIQLIATAAGARLEWNTVPGSVYQAQKSNDFQTWSDLGAVHFASGSTLSTLVTNNSGDQTYYRVIRIR